MKKFELTNKVVRNCRKKLYRIRALKDFGDVRAGELGGYLENESNLSQDGAAWVYDEACVCDNAKVLGNAVVKGNACVCGYAKITDDAYISGNACIADDAGVYDDAYVVGNASVGDNAKIFDKAFICGDAWVTNNATIHGEAKIYDNAKIAGDAIIRDSVEVYGDADVYGNVRILGNAKINGNADIRYNTDYIHISSFVFSDGYTDFMKSRNNTILVNCRWFEGDIEEFEKMLKEFSEKQAKAYMCAIKLAKAVIELYEDKK